MAPACLFLAAKVEEQPRKLEHVIKVAHACLNRDHNTPTPDPRTEVQFYLFETHNYSVRN
jgi:cyclin T